MTSRYLFLLKGFLMAMILVGCEKELDLSAACDLTFRGLDWKLATSDQDFGCAFYLEKYAYKGAFYYGMNSHCADVAFNLASCDGVELCQTDPAFLCDKIIRRGDFIGIVAYLEE